MRTKVCAILLILLWILTSCIQNLENIKKSVTLALQPTASEIPVPSPVPLRYQLTYVSDQHEGFSGVYAMDVGCLDQDIPCFSKPYLLFELILPQDITSIAWSPNGKQVAYCGLDKDFSDIFVSDWNGENTINITDSSSWENRPIWMPDGFQIIFETKLTPIEKTLVLKNLKNQTLQNLLTGANLSSPGQAVIFPNTKKIIFNALSLEGIDAGTQQIYIADLDGSNLSKLTQNQNDNFDPSLSPDSKSIVIENVYNMDDVYSNLVMLCLDGTCNNAITERNKGVRTMFPAWAPFGDWIAYTNHIDFTSDIYLVKKDGSVTLKLTQTNYSETYPAWRTISP